MFLPPVMRPLPGPATPERPGLQRIAETPVSIVRGPPGSYLAEGLASVILGWRRWQDCVWLRPQDTHPSTLPPRWSAPACTAGTTVARLLRAPSTSIWSA